MSNTNAAARDIFDAVQGELLDPNLPDAERNRRLTAMLKESGIGAGRFLTGAISKAIGNHLAKKAAPAGTRRVDAMPDADDYDPYDPYGMGIAPAHGQREPVDLHILLLHILQLVPVEQQREAAARLVEDLNPNHGVRQGFFRSLLAGYKAARGRAS
jgi:hypothetical protein